MNEVPRAPSQSYLRRPEQNTELKNKPWNFCSLPSVFGILALPSPPFDLFRKLPWCFFPALLVLLLFPKFSLGMREEKGFCVFFLQKLIFFSLCYSYLFNHLEYTGESSYCHKLHPLTNSQVVLMMCFIRTNRWIPPGQWRLKMLVLILFYIQTKLSVLIQWYKGEVM